MFIQCCCCSISIDYHVYIAPAPLPFTHPHVIYYISDRKCGFIHLRIADQAGSGFVLGQYSRPFDTLADCIAYYCRRKLNIKGISHETLQFPVSR